jgi:hypothetical protein
MKRSNSAHCLRAIRNLAPAAALVVGTPSVALAYRCPQTPSPPQTETYQGFLGRVKQLNGKDLPYRLFVPPSYDPSKPYPLVLYLHHAGLAGTDSNNESKWDNCVQLTSEIGSGDDYGGVFTHRAVDKDGNRFDTQARYPHFVLAPHAESPAYGFGGGGEGSATRAEHPTRPHVWSILDDVRAEFNIDPRRLYVTGISMGCYGTWDIIMRSPGVFAAASPQSCRGDPNEMMLAKLKDTPIWSMCGTNDSYFAGAQAMADAMEAVDATAFTFTAMQGVGHSINDRGYDYPGFIDWMFAQRLPGGGSGSGGAAGAGGTAAGASSTAGNGGVASSAGASAVAGNGGGGEGPSLGGGGAGATAGEPGNGGAPAAGSGGRASSSGGASSGGASAMGGVSGTGEGNAGKAPFGGNAGGTVDAAGMGATAAGTGGESATSALPPNTGEPGGCAVVSHSKTSGLRSAVCALLLAIANWRRRQRRIGHHAGAQLPLNG